ncbi:50S ribosomal protein L17 [Mycobacteroides abscessus subsp. abscessus]|nr:50S ribosomal protein L17 [Mycobacteroides abscessus subsp. abscessus]
MAIIELVKEKTVTSEADRARRVASTKKVEAPAEEAKVDEVVEVEADTADDAAAEAEGAADTADAAEDADKKD